MNDLGEIFRKLDKLRPILEQTLHGWTPPQIIAIGTESSGKSTVLERLAMMSIFPRSENMCTRLPIHVHLRRTPVPCMPRLVVTNTRTKMVEKEYFISVDSGHVDVQQEMNEVLKRYNNGYVTGVIDNVIIELFISNADVPCLDLVDMPGLIQNAADNEPENIKSATRTLLLNYIDMYKDRSIYLGVIPAGTSLRSDIAFSLIKEKNLQVCHLMCTYTPFTLTQCHYRIRLLG